MSRIGRMPVVIPAGTEVTVADGNVVTVKGKLGTLTEAFNHRITIAVEGNEIIVTRPTDEKEDRSLHGLTRALIANMVEGVTNGFSKRLEIVGVGYKVVKHGIRQVAGNWFHVVLRFVSSVCRIAVKCYESGVCR